MITRTWRPGKTLRALRNLIDLANFVHETLLLIRNPVLAQPQHREWLPAVVEDLGLTLLDHDCDRVSPEVWVGARSAVVCGVLLVLVGFDDLLIGGARVLVIDHAVDKEQAPLLGLLRLEDRLGLRLL